VNLTRGENGRPGGGRGQGERLSRGSSAARGAWGLATRRLSHRAAVTLRPRWFCSTMEPYRGGESAPLRW